MNLLIKSATIIDPNSPFNQQIADLLIEKGHISNIGPDIEADAEVIDADGKCCPGFFD